MVVVHGDCGRNLSSGAGSVMDPMFMEASLFVRVSSDSPPLNVPRSEPSSQMGHIEASFRSISACAWVDPFMGTSSHSDKGDSVLPSHANGLSSAKDGTNLKIWLLMVLVRLLLNEMGRLRLLIMGSFKSPYSKSVNRMEFWSISIAQSVVLVSNDFSAIRNDLDLSEDVVVPHSLVSNASVISSDPIASTIFSDYVSLTASREQQS
ncbi:hypothetical protein QYF36_000966 [Acer negundo]|nr:hypothetical protein QYF36_000966 [Acer negundo]